MKGQVLIVTLLLANLASAVTVVQAKHVARGLQNELQELRVERDHINTEWSQLQLEESAWANHGRVEHIARERLGMSEPQGYSVIAVDSAWRTNATQ
ncbi:MAG: cell division protein FtsL [Salinisphaeraceae bacterium]|nr:cell division protein FtsL [Salinisphaeraceae bacterium]